ncbi:MAG TPA: hypothetical protein VLB00_15955 [Gemmatimonadales bacterium]|nr:hypothetical protein [Gemmatimonadales bacterium]
MLRLTRLSLLVVVVPCSVQAQHGAGASQAPVSAPAEARQHDFLVGQWELVVKVPPAGLAQRIHGVPRLVGTWKAWRAFDGFGVEDELRITDEAGNPRSLSHALRYYDRSARTWKITVLDVYRGRLTSATGEWKDGRMVQNGQGTDPEGKPVLVRSRFHDITPTSFKWQQDRSSDNGKSWTEGTLRIEARRVAAAAPR